MNRACCQPLHVESCGYKGTAPEISRSWLHSRGKGILKSKQRWPHACRFGVEQRARLAAKASPPPHVMYMTATPIPRTLALCEHGDLALYVIDELPPGRQPITTRVIKDSPSERAQVSWQPWADLAGSAGFISHNCVLYTLQVLQSNFMCCGHCAVPALHGPAPLSAVYTLVLQACSAMAGVPSHPERAC